MLKQQSQQEQPLPPGVMDALYPAPLSPEARKQAQARRAQQQARRMAELQAMEVARQEREARRQAEEQAFKAFAEQAAARREAFANGEIAPAQAASIPTLTQYFQGHREQEVKQQAETRAAIAKSAYAMPAYRLPPGSKFLKDSKEKIINGAPSNES